MRVLVIEPEKKPEEKEIDDSLKAMQKIVGGLIQPVYPFDDSVALVCNDEGRLIGLPMNRALRDETGKVYDILCGTFFICGISGDRFTSLTEEQVHHFKQVFGIPEMFMKAGSSLIVLPLI